MSILSITKKILQQEEKDKDKNKKKKTAEKKETKKAPEQVSVLAGEIGLKPIMSEKSFSKQYEGNIVVFRVRPEASKGQIAEAIKDKYNVNALKVRTMQYKPKNRRRGATTGRTNYWKKAYVTVDDMSAINTAP